jgi:hypothetical protein
LHYRDRSHILAVFGLGLLGAGLFAAFLGPLEMYCFYLFTEGGQFHYEGFGFGSFMFGNIASQIIGYYLIAAVLIPLGYGHLRLRLWARTLSVALLWFWLVVGVPLVILFMAVLVSSKEVTPPLAAGALVLLVLSYAFFPWLLLRFYKGNHVRATFQAADPKFYWTEKRPMTSLVTGSLFLFFAVVLHIPILFNGLYPLFGTWLSGLPGIVALDLTIMAIAYLGWGLLRHMRWAWWGGTLVLGTLILSAISTLILSSYQDLLVLADFPLAELEFLQGIPAQGYHFALLVGLPMVVTWLVLAFSKRVLTSPFEAKP